MWQLKRYDTANCMWQQSQLNFNLNPLKSIGVEIPNRAPLGFLIRSVTSKCVARQQIFSGNRWWWSVTNHA